MLLVDMREAFGTDKVMRSSDLIAKLTADPEKPWAEYDRGKPLTQRQLAKMLGDFGIISNTVRPPKLPLGKGYKRIDLEPQWEAYCPPNPARAAFRSIPGRFKRNKVTLPMGRAQLAIFHP